MSKRNSFLESDRFSGWDQWVVKGEEPSALTYSLYFTILFCRRLSSFRTSALKEWALEQS